MDRAYIRLNRHMTRLNFAFEQESSRPTRLAAEFLCLRACSNGPRGAARTQLGSSRLRAPFALRSCPSRECTTAGSSHTPGKCSSREWGLAIRSSSAFRMNTSPGGVRTCRLLRLRCSNIAPMPQLGALALASFVHGQYSNHGADGGSRT